MSIDSVAIVAEFAEDLRAAGAEFGVDRVTAAAETLGPWGVASGAEPYWPLRIAFFSTMLMVPATDCVEYSALAARSTSMRSMTSGESESIEKPAGARSPLSRICDEERRRGARAAGARGPGSCR